jgi:protein gp37
MAHLLESMHQSKYAGLTVLRNGIRTFNGKITLDEDALTIPLRWKKPRRIFVNSMSDLFHNDVPFEFVDKVFAVMALCPQHTFQILTKRPARMAEYLVDRESWIAQAIEAPMWAEGVDWDAADCHLHDWPLTNVWLGTSVEDQARADERIPWLLKCPAKVRFLSCEPLLGPINPNDTCGKGEKLWWPDWVIVGGESGHNSRPCNVEWIRSIVGQCKDAEVACFVKQLGAKAHGLAEPDDGWANPRFRLGTFAVKDSKGGDPSEWPEDLRVREFPTSHPSPPPPGPQINSQTPP